MIKKNGYTVAVFHVCTNDKNTRKNLVEFLENEGLVCKDKKETERDIILNSRFPLVIDTFNQQYTMLHNTVCAAAAASSKILISEEEFYVLYKGSECTFSEYIAAVRRALNRLSYSDEEVAALFSTPEIEEVLNENYEDYKKGLDWCRPAETANSLELEIE